MIYNLSCIFLLNDLKFELYLQNEDLQDKLYLLNDFQGELHFF